MNSFWLGLQFLTRITVKKNIDWSPKACGESVKFFPIYGFILGLVYVLLGTIFFVVLPMKNYIFLPPFTAFVFLLSNLVMTGALHCDGFCDTMDGILSGRNRERILEIMKDSRVGAHGATSLIALLIGKYAMFMSLTASSWLIALLLFPVFSRYCMSLAVVLFPYARPEGLGKGFHEFSDARDLILPTIFVLALACISGYLAVLVLVSSVFTMLVLDRYVNRLLGGLTGDVYGATTELGEAVVLMYFVIFQTFIYN